MPQPQKFWLALISASLLTLSAASARAQTGTFSDDDWVKQHEEDVRQEEIAARKIKESLTFRDTVFNIPVLANQHTDPDTFIRSREILRAILDPDYDGKADNTELTEFMASNGFQVIVTRSSSELDDISEDDFPEEKTALISDWGLKVDSYLLENLRIIAEGKIGLLKKQAEENNRDALDNLASLENAILQLKEHGLLFDDPEDDEDEPGDKADYIMMSELVLSGQLSTVLDRLSYVLDKTLEEAAAVSDQYATKDDFNFDLSPAYRKWRNLTPEGFHEMAPLMCEWLQNNQLTAPVVVLKNVPPVVEIISADNLPATTDQPEEKAAQ